MECTCKTVTVKDPEGKFVRWIDADNRCSRCVKRDELWPEIVASIENGLHECVAVNRIGRARELKDLLARCKELDNA